MIVEVIGRTIALHRLLTRFWKQLCKIVKVLGDTVSLQHQNDIAFLTLDEDSLMQVEHTVQSSYTKSSTFLYKFNNTITFSNKLMTKIDNSVRLFFENMNSLPTSMGYLSNF